LPCCCCRYGLPIVPGGFNMSVLLYDNHPGSRWTSELDCSHYCHPGLPEVGILSVATS
jgi:hypothetical protein